MRRRVATCLAVIVACVAALSCNDPERLAARMYDEAQEKMEAGDVREASELLRRIVDDYPDTEAASQARREVNLMRGLYEAETLYPVRTARLLMAATARALMRYRDRHGHYPSSLDALQPDYLREPPVDPWGRALEYELGANGRTYRLRSLGRDGKPGGSDDDTDWIIENNEFVSKVKGA